MQTGVDTLEQRRHERRACRRRVVVEHVGTGLLDEASCLDVSDAGLMLSLRGACEVGEELRVEFNVPGRAISMHGLVRWTRDGTDPRLQNVGVQLHDANIKETTLPASPLQFAVPAA
jgi:hypothetical protein